MCLGLATGYIKKEEKQSLLKPYTNYDKIKDMSVEELAKFIDTVADCCSNCIDCDNCF